MKNTILLITAAIALTGCGKEQVSTEIVDQNQIISRENAELNAKGWARNRYPDHERVLVDSDSTIDSSCRFGDGWASADVILAGGAVVSLKCQTTGSGKGYNGCLMKPDFMKKEYAGEEGKCNSSITKLSKLGQ